MKPAIDLLFKSRNALIEKSKSNWNDGTINLPVFYTEFTYFFNHWEIRIQNEDRDMVYKDNDYFQDQVVNLWNFKAFSTNFNSDFSFSLEKSTWFERNVLHKSRVKCECNMRRFKLALEANPTINDLMRESFVNFSIHGVFDQDVFEITTSFNVNKFTMKKVELAIHIFEEIINELDRC